MFPLPRGPGGKNAANGGRPAVTRGPTGQMLLAVADALDSPEDERAGLLLQTALLEPGVELSTHC